MSSECKHIYSNEFIPYILSDGKVHCCECGHAITKEEWWKMYLKDEGK